MVNSISSAGQNGVKRFGHECLIGRSAVSRYESMLTHNLPNSHHSSGTEYRVRSTGSPWKVHPRCYCYGCSGLPSECCVFQNYVTYLPETSKITASSSVWSDKRTIV